MNRTSLCIRVPIGSQAHNAARKFASQQSTPQQGKQVYLNTLAVYAVHDYLTWLACETDLTHSDSWHPILRIFSDVADVILPGVGKLECRPVLPGQTTLQVSFQEDRIGYVAVQFSEALNEVQLLGFLPAIAHRSQFSLADLQPLETLIELLPASVPSRIPINLSRWFENWVEPGWQAVEMLFSSVEPALALRSNRAPEVTETIAVRRGKLVRLESESVEETIALIVALTPAEQDEVEISLQVYPTGPQLFLPPVQLTVLDETGASIPQLVAQAQEADQGLQLGLSGRSGERFTVRLVLEDASVTEDFVI